LLKNSLILKTSSWRRGRDSDPRNVINPFAKLANGCILAATSRKGINQVFNVTYGITETLYKFVKILSKHFKNLKYKIDKRDNFRPKRGTLSIKKAKKFLNYKPNYSLDKGVKKYLEFINSIKEK
jgi:nucleoside-diphosphate-sugar epimerase